MKRKSKKIISNSLIYFFLIIGYIAFYVLGIENLIYNQKGQAPKSKVNFVYQQF